MGICGHRAEASGGQDTPQKVAVFTGGRGLGQPSPVTPPWQTSCLGAQRAGAGAGVVREQVSRILEKTQGEPRPGRTGAAEPSAGRRREGSGEEAPRPGAERPGRGQGEPVWWLGRLRVRRGQQGGWESAAWGLLVNREEGERTGRGLPPPPPFKAFTAFLSAEGAILPRVRGPSGIGHSRKLNHLPPTCPLQGGGGPSLPLLPVPLPSAPSRGLPPTLPGTIQRPVSL